MATIPDRPPMLGATAITAWSVWALLLGMGMLMLGNGMQGTLLGLRASDEGFASSVTGLVMSAYFIGFFGGTHLTPVIIERVGHVRVFAAMASIASAAILVHAMWVTPAAWFAMRAVTGFAYSGLYVVTESWLNDRASNDTRGRLLSIYLIVTFVSMGGGQLTMNLASPGAYYLFLLNAIILSLAIIPILLSNNPQPDSSAPEPLSLRQLYRISPLGTVGTFATGMSHGAVFGMAAVFARSQGLSVAEVSFFMVSLIAGGALLQWPIGRLSDRIDRRRVITAVSLLAAVVAALAVPVGHVATPALIAAGFVLGGLVLPMYGLFVAYTNDHLKPQQMVAASSGLYKSVAIGAIIGPSLTGWLMDMFGPDGFLWYFVAIHLAVVAYARYRMAHSPAPEERSPYSPVPGGSAELVETWVEQVTESESTPEDTTEEAGRPAESGPGEESDSSRA